MANVALMVNLNPMTWVRFIVWMVIGKILRVTIEINSYSCFVLLNYFRICDLFRLRYAP